MPSDTYRAWVAAHPDLSALTDVQKDHEAALVMGWHLAWDGGLWASADGSRCIGIRSYRPTADPAQAAELRAFTAREVTGWVEVTTYADYLPGCEVHVSVEGPPMAEAEGPTESDASTRACLIALRKHRGLA